MLETLDHTIRIGSTPTFFIYFDLYLYSAYAAKTCFDGTFPYLDTDFWLTSSPEF